MDTTFYFEFLYKIQFIIFVKSIQDDFVECLNKMTKSLATCEATLVSTRQVYEDIKMSFNNGEIDNETFIKHEQHLRFSISDLEKLRDEILIKLNHFENFLKQRGMDKNGL